MNAFSALLAIALLAYTASATPCTDICNGQCALKKNVCDFAEVFGNLCEIENSVCTKACDAACGCADTCATKCGGDYATCKGDASGVYGVLNVYRCGLNLSVCSATCQLQCKFNLFASVVQSLGSGSGSGDSGDGGDGGQSVISE
ncbi:hypothetical protein ElyMa_001897300 [Elysia marginata]|uniref:Uncharacterized protein n=1 Tax=Elysia marginata TaxID=1093978 RepID=A0AAV4ES84_9GAST|nr:hypothetical protein ElyMa_001897300 [Elysia marginata]